MDADVSPSTLRSIQKIACWSPMVSLAAATAERLRSGDDFDIRVFVAAYYPMGFITSTSISKSVLQWVFSRREVAPQDTIVVASPLGPFTQKCVFADVLCPMSSIGDHEVLEMLLETPACVDDSEAMTAMQRQSILDEALRCTRDETSICLLLAHGADPQAVTEGFTRSPYGAREVCSSLAPHIEHGLFTVGDSRLLANDVRCSLSWTLVHDLVRAGVDPIGEDTVADTKILSIMIHTPVDVDHRFADGQTALIEAVNSRLRKLAQALLDVGADVDARGRHNETALSRAIRLEDPRLITYLLEGGADPRLCDDRGSSPLHGVCDRSELFGYVERLLDRGADPNLRDGDGYSPLDILRAHRKDYNRRRVDEVIQLLIAHGADPRSSRASLIASRKRRLRLAVSPRRRTHQRRRE